MKNQSITSLPLSPDAERHSRMIKYSVAMGIRVLCLVSILFVPGWWAIIPAIGAIFLPYFAVVIANVGANPHANEVERPGNIMPMFPTRPPGRLESDETSADETHADETQADETHADDASEDRNA
ncbi:MAG: hypothetical protein QOJ77_708 [Microbacteriaceae bacterium]|jgi:hypothetical protein|nr:hypothetical protein [Microbacteriaceae bacterium]